jgi:predicted XRE-type DNA-binding protein
MANNGKVLDFGVAKSRQEKATTRSEGMIPVTEGVGSEFDYYKAEMKTSLMVFITSVCAGVKQIKAAELLDITQAQVSMIRNNRISQFSIDKLMEIAWKAGYGMELHPHKIANSISFEHELSTDSQRKEKGKISEFEREVE